MENQNLQTNQEKNSISLVDLLFVLKRNLLLIIGITFIFTLAGAIYGLNYKSYTYSTNATVMVRADSQSTSAGNYNDTVQSLRIIATVKDFIVNDVVMEAVAEELVEKSGLDINVTYIKNVVKGGLSLSSEEDSLILTLSFRSTIYKLNSETEDIFVIDALNTVITKAQEVSATIIETTNAAGEIKTEYKYPFVANNIQELSFAKNYSGTRGAAKVIMLCCVIGAVVGYLLALMLYLLDDTYKTKEEVEEATGIPVLAFIEDIQLTGGTK